MKVISGKEISQKIQQELTEQIKELSFQPCLAVVLVGDRKDSQVYVRMKKRMCQKIGIKSVSIELPDTISQRELVEKVDQLNDDPEVHGILIQLPLPDHIDEREVLNRVKLEKDVDGFHSVNIGKLALKDNPQFVPCTPDGCLEMLRQSNVEIEGKHVVILGRSRIVGLPLSLLLLHENATVTICHSRTKDPMEICKQADILIAACGRAQMVKKEWIKEGAVIIDVGINPIDDPSKKKGYRLVGDVDFEDVSPYVSHITPVPGGVGPMTIIMLMKHTVEAAMKQH